ncbi:MAG TPA: hypothetical protein VM536_18040 [Chloroflexia bacterium]|nr:hypothetical protein [Chloroflexia bacterium]
MYHAEPDLRARRSLQHGHIHILWPSGLPDRYGYAVRAGGLCDRHAHGLPSALHFANAHVPARRPVQHRDAHPVPERRLPKRHGHGNKPAGEHGDPDRHPVAGKHGDQHSHLDAYEYADPDRDRTTHQHEHRHAYRDQYGNQHPHEHRYCDGHTHVYCSRAL